MQNIETKRKQLLYRSTHRGCKETDILIGEFAARYIPSFSLQELLDYERFLEIDDVILYDLICEKESPEDSLVDSKIIKLIINFNRIRINAA
ncbi:hypothetical protein NF27_CG01710 [Candidatus Jidaibacter acanthamoeba]|uniref:FAD assembly factor SdhE n=1 Tax=Candidatus Jidaibacter acanthamoebae TaxID=86105 RepID=A0A0C1N102_9RICK|nr:succinate dehydrogenase assembly factor 2 [Candidatus Jidaibacter acanthamoeba]KIE05991.1 hypothetical protein NF27_CG01710 [Candidatus Jidaibacter acanthamoeba]